jgi:hypothetical protein
MSDLTAEQGAARMAAFGAWIEKVGPALVDVGQSVRDERVRSR